ncbi:hypothetical protein [Wolbachia endosymbiont (group A) of Campoletis raptor]|uniref:hypothetical protein n=1 Tax=Wolbachia endosymbiont (group A) of Campoletis raptor TaxID=3066196 RepID=UPI003132B63C
MNLLVSGQPLSSAINKQLVMNSLLMAINRRKPVKNLLLHSDQGSQYTAQGYQYLLEVVRKLVNSSIFPL